MNKQEIHKQIFKITEKIQHLNNAISAGEEIHSVEIDLLSAYIRDLENRVLSLGSFTESPPDKLKSLDKEQDEIEKSIVIEENNNYSETPELSKESDEEIPIEEIVQEFIEEKKEENQIANQQFEEETTNKSEEIEPNEELILPQQDISQETEEIPKGISAEKPQQQINSITNEEDQIEDFQATGENFKATPSTEEEEIFVETNDQKTPSLHERFMQKDDLSKNKIRITHKHVKSLKECFDLNERFTYSRELFEGNMEYFESALREIGNKPNKQIAVDFIHSNLVDKYKWNQKEGTANRFIEAIEEYFVNN